MKHIKQTYITTMPDKAGAFLLASKIISKNGGNIVRVNYNKTVDVHTLFIEVYADTLSHSKISAELLEVGYLTQPKKHQKVILIVLKLQDEVGTVTPVLEIINNYDINVTYISSQETGTPYQYFKMGLMVDNADEIKNLLEDISQVCEVKILDYDITEKSLDNTVFYITFANEMRDILNLTQEQTNSVIINSNRIMQMLDERDEMPLKTFDYIKQFASFVMAQKEDKFEAQTEIIVLDENLLLHVIEPPCGSNTYILQRDNELLFIDCGFKCYEKEMLKVLSELLGDLSKYKKNIIITHSDIDHTGLLDLFDNIYLNASCYENFVLEHQSLPNFREQNVLHKPYCKLSKMISGYNPPNLDKCVVLGKKQDNELISEIAEYNFFDTTLKIYEGIGGHVKGETIIVSEKYKLVFTGDVLVNAKGFSEKQKHFNMLAPYLMTSVNVDSSKAKQLREFILDKYKGYTFLTGHGSKL